MAYMAFSQKLIIDENAKFSAEFRTVVKAPENAAQMTPVITRDLRDNSQRQDTIHMLKSGPKMPTTEDMLQSRYVMYVLSSPIAAP